MRSEIIAQGGILSQGYGFPFDFVIESPRAGVEPPAWGKSPTKGKNYQIRFGFDDDVINNKIIDIRVAVNQYGHLNIEYSGDAYKPLLMARHRISFDPVKSVWNPVASSEFDSSQYVGEGKYYSEQYAELWGNPPADSSIIAKMVSNLLESVMWSLWRFFGLQDPVTLFFDVDPQVLFTDTLESMDVDPNAKNWFTTSKNSLYVNPDSPDTFLYMFNLREHRLIGTLYNVFGKVLQIPYVLSIAIIGFMLFVKGIGAEDRSSLNKHPCKW